jgi:hypothetical protein
VLRLQTEDISICSAFLLAGKRWRYSLNKIHYFNPIFNLFSYCVLCLILKRLGIAIDMSETLLHLYGFNFWQKKGGGEDVRTVCHPCGEERE